LTNEGWPMPIQRLGEAARRQLAPRGADEAQRLATLQSYEVLDTEAEEAFDLIAELASELTGCPLALITFVDRDRVWTKAAHGSPRSSQPRDAQLCAWSITQAPGLHLADLRAPGVMQGAEAAADQGFRMYASRNLVAPDGSAVGVLCVLNSRPHPLSPRQLALLEGLSRQAVLLLEHRRSQLLAARAQEDFIDLATRDPLTGLANRVAWAVLLQAESERHQRYRSPFALLAFDLDHFKTVNDRHGHAAGDAVLRHVAATLQHCLRRTDIAARLGGDEFVVLLPNTTHRQATRLAERWRGTLADERLTAGGVAVSLSCSIGVASTEDQPHDLAALQRLADARSYQAKRAGRNRVVSS
jgi:diguanylate cyclase (GGDEF)-like protein